MSVSPFLLPVGVHHDMEPLAECRDPRQRAKVIEIASRADFDFSCGNPFTEEVSAGYRGPFNFIYYTKNGDFHVKKIGATGRILSHQVVKNGQTGQVIKV